MVKILFSNSIFSRTYKNLRSIYGHEILVAHPREARGGSHRGLFRGSRDCSVALHRRSCPPLSRHRHCPNPLYCLWYILNTRWLSGGSVEGEKVKHEVHSRSTGKLQELCFENGGVYTKLGQQHPGHLVCFQSASLSMHEIKFLPRTDDGQKLSVRVFIDVPLTENKFCTCLVELSFHILPLQIVPLLTDGLVDEISDSLPKASRVNIRMGIVEGVVGCPSGSSNYCISLMGKTLMADILLRGYYGWNSRRAIQVLDQVFPKEAPVQPSLVIVYFGGNDSMGPHSSGLGPHVPLDEYIENMRKIAIHLKSLSDTSRIIFLSCPPVDETRVGSGLSGIFSELIRTNELCQNYSNACIKLCQEMGVEVVDLFSAFQKRDDWTKACFTDGVHLSAEGSKIVVEEILKVLREAEWVPSLHWKSMPTEFSEDSPYYLVTADGKRTLNPSEWTFHREIQWD
ncbi:hypothetical protein POTOM_038567 [Populus tomentosa]|uniref:SGNH hydrolase-type esterase domain-containing protein n=1 Tax=Populus tomentosa TaxID=118781 RepID=A0A8X8CLF4_POPTO|nr:hypothetical protein POTOM_038567 [Populus tomentosa]